MLECRARGTEMPDEKKNWNNKSGAKQQLLTARMQNNGSLRKKSLRVLNNLPWLHGHVLIFRGRRDEIFYLIILNIVELFLGPPPSFQHQYRAF